MHITKDEAFILYQGLYALNKTARNDEPHSADTQEFAELFKKVKEYADIDGIIKSKVG